MDNAEAGGEFGRAAVEADAGASAGLADDLDFEPVDSATDAGAEGFGAGLLGGEAGRKAFGCVALSHAVGLFGGGEDTVQEALSEAVEGLLDSVDFDQIDATADDHAVYKLTSGAVAGGMGLAGKSRMINRRALPINEE